MTSARRQARTRAALPVGAESTGGIPTALALGRCIEVWSCKGEFDSSPSMSAFSRWGRVRDWWLATNGITDTAEQCRLLPFHGPWSLEFLLQQGRADWALQKFQSVGATLDDVPPLREQAMDLHDRAAVAAPY